MAENEETYEDWTVEELRGELKARGLHTSGNKDELVARLEENDVTEEEAAPTQSEEAPGTAVEAVEAEAKDEDAPLIDPPRVYSPWELPSNTAAAQAFVDAHPESVDPELKLEPPERHEAAQANIQDHVDQMGEFGVEVEDPRLEGYSPPEPAEPVEPPPAPDEVEEETVDA